ncbi:DNA polymerase/primase [Mycobacterium phage DS6A]|uniref:DNA primase n=1 Tax=Mycobacterium phage DS6A TaxID=45764 RepID=G8I4I7_9CAUD|nr:DNA polymerase/primase [Mycobacterium phage DS6A]AER47631.1 DNA primase [Mycobacterium phage DS6A]
MYTTCPTCRDTLELADDWAPAEGAEHRPPVHDGCPPAPLTPVDQLYENFRELVARIAAPDYKPRMDAGTNMDELNLDALKAKIDQHDQQPPRLGDAALIYASWGWPVFPLRPVGAPCRNGRRDKCARICQCPKTPATPNGFKDATTDAERIRTYWAKVPGAGIGIATGHAFDVIDLDLPDGPASWAAMSGKLPVHGQVLTGNGGRHLYTPVTGARNGARIAPGVDYRGLGGYVVAPPSWLGDHGHKWRWLTKPSPALTGPSHVNG